MKPDLKDCQILDDILKELEEQDFIHVEDFCFKHNDYKDIPKKDRKAKQEAQKRYEKYDAILQEKGLIEYPQDSSCCQLTSSGKIFNGFVNEFKQEQIDNKEIQYNNLKAEQREYIDDEIKKLTIESLKQNIFKAKYAVWFIILNVILSAVVAWLVNYF